MGRQLLAIGRIDLLGLLTMDRSASLIAELENITGPRRVEPVYPLANVLFMTICAVIAGADDYVAIAKFANTKKRWFAKFLDTSTGVSSHDRFNATMTTPLAKRRFSWSVH